MAQPLRGQPRFRAGDPVSLEDLRRLAELAERAEGFPVVAAEQTGAYGPGGFQVAGPLRIPLWGQIIDRPTSQAIYSWVEVQHDSAGNWITVTGGASGTGNAYEVLSNSDVPTDGAAIVRLWPSEAQNGEAWRFVYTGLTVELDDESVVVPNVHKLAFHKPTFLLPLLLGNVPDAKLNWGPDIQPVGTVNFEGTSERPARSNHIHALITRTTFDPPPGTVSNTIIFNEINNTLWFYVGGFIGWVPICPCPGWGPSGSLQGSGSAGTPGEIITPCCDGVLIPNQLFVILRPGSLPGCECLAPFTIFQIDYDAETETWSGGTTICGALIIIVFYCYSNPSWAFEVHGPGGVATNTDFPASCSPDFEWPLDTAFEIDLAGTGICLGTITAGVSS